jgi:hypothetical protein
VNQERNISPTPYNDINFFLYILLDNSREVLDKYFVGMYLYGSLTSGEFDIKRSDIDFLVVTSEELPENIVSSLKAMHLALYESGTEWAGRLEGAYMPASALRAQDPTGPLCVRVNFNKLVRKTDFWVERPEARWVVNRHMIYTSSIVLMGPPIKTLVDPVQPQELKEAVITSLRNNWSPKVPNSSFFLGIEYQPFVILQMCRALYILKQGAVASKLSSAEWVIANSDPRWTDLIKQAMAWHPGDPSWDIGQTREFIRYVLKEAGV